MSQTPDSSMPLATQERTPVLLPALGVVKAHQARVGMLHPAEENPLEHWEAWGFSLVDPSVEQEQIGGVPALLPAGWTLHPADDRRTAVLLDDQGRGRAFMAVPSPTSPQCCMVVWPRFIVMPHYAPTVSLAEPREGETPFTHWCYKVVDAFFPNRGTDGIVGRLLYSSHAFEADNASEGQSGHASAMQSCKLWLSERWPDWENPFAYWQAEEKP